MVVVSVYRFATRSSHKSKRPVKSIACVKIFTAGGAFDTGKMIGKAYKTLLDTDIDVVMDVDSKHLFTVLTAQRQSNNKSI